MSDELHGPHHGAVEGQFDWQRFTRIWCQAVAALYHSMNQGRVELRFPSEAALALDRTAHPAV